MAVGVGVGVGVGPGVDGIFTGFLGFTSPFFQTNVLPDLIHVYLVLTEMMVEFSLEQTDPGLTAACAFEGSKVPAITTEMSHDNLFFIEQT